MNFPTIRTQLLTGSAEFTALNEPWNNLLGNTRQETVFLSWQWLHTWWQVFGDDSMQLQILLFRSGDELVGIAPMYLQSAGLLQGKILRFIGTGEAEADHVVSEYLDVFASGAHEKAVLAAMAQWLTQNRKWRRLQFDDVLETSLALRLVALITGKNNHSNYHLDQHTSGHRYFISLPDSMEEYLQRLSSSRRKRYGRCTRALVKDGGDASGERLGNLDELPGYLPVLQQLNAERWRDKGGIGVFESARFSQFHQQLCALLVPSGGAGITLLKQAESPVAALYLLFSRSVCHYYQSGFRAQGANRYMPLFVAHMAEIQRSIECKLDTYDFMRGTTESYKLDYGCDSETMYPLRAWPNNAERLSFISIRRLRARLVQRLRAAGLLGKRP